MALVDTAKIGKMGGEARAANMSAEERSEAARAAVNARWAKAGKSEKPATTKKKAGKSDKGKK